MRNAASCARNRANSEITKIALEIFGFKDERQGRDFLDFIISYGKALGSRHGAFMAKY